ncbi:MAG: alpha/beta hydrolase family protein [Fimbriimonadaceae bacterium]|nr:MAG: alpha/beta hydrolase family protein [Fimbriimonadaceae bacterium]
MAARLVIMVGLIVCWLGAYAQVSDVLTAPEKITFPNWDQVGRTEDYSEFRVAFPSPLVTEYPENNTVSLQVFMPASPIGKPPVVLLLHFWGATDSELEREMAQELALRGIASVIMPMPYHLSRTPAGKRSGELAIVPDPKALRQTMIQSIADIRRTLDWVQSRPEIDSNSIGITGTSLGAIVSALAFGVEPRIKSAGFMLGGADLAYLMMNSSRTTSARAGLRADGWTEEKLREELVDIEPLNYLSLDDKRPSYLISARYDTVVPPESGDRLREKLSNVQTLMLDTGHYGGFLVKSRLSRSMAAFFDATLRGRQFNAPTKFYSPTVRFSLLADLQSGVQVGAGLDLWRSNTNADTFAAIYITPRGPQGYFGFRLGKGVSLGAMFSRSGTSPGLVWSTVF